MKNTQYAGPVDGQNTRELLASNHASAVLARSIKRIEENYIVTVSGNDLCYTLRGETTPTAYVAAVFGKSGEIQAVASPGFYEVMECDLRAFEAAAIKRAWKNAEKRTALAAYEATMPEREARLAAKDYQSEAAGMTAGRKFLA